MKTNIFLPVIQFVTVSVYAIRKVFDLKSSYSLRNEWMAYEETDWLVVCKAVVPITLHVQGTHVEFLGSFQFYAQNKTRSLYEWMNQ